MYYFPNDVRVITPKEECEKTKTNLFYFPPHQLRVIFSTRCERFLRICSHAHNWWRVLNLYIVRHPPPYFSNDRFAYLRMRYFGKQNVILHLSIRLIALRSTRRARFVPKFRRAWMSKIWLIHSTKKNTRTAPTEPFESKIRQTYEHKLVDHRHFWRDVNTKIQREKYLPKKKKEENSIRIVRVRRIFVEIFKTRALYTYLNLISTIFA